MGELTDGIIEKVKLALNDERTTTKTELSDLRTEVKQLLADTDATSKQERNELRDMLKSITDDIASRKKAEAEKDRVKDNSNTIVVPPSDVKPVQPTEPEQPPAEVIGEEASKVSLFKRIW